MVNRISSRRADDGVCVIGLGNLGSALGRRLVQYGVRVVGVDIDEAAREEWREVSGVEAVRNIADVPWAELGAVFVVVRTADQALAVLAQLRTNMSRGQFPTCYVISTLDPTSAQQLGGFDPPPTVIELPVSGGAEGALAGTLTAMAAGPLTADDQKFLSTTIAADVVRFDSYGDPSSAKLLNNLVAAFNARALAETLELGDELGIHPSILHKVISASSGGSWIARAYMDLLDATLAKDVSMLREHFGSLPVLDVSDPAEFVERLVSARKLLIRSSPHRPGSENSHGEG